MAEKKAAPPATTIMYGNVDANGALDVQFFCEQGVILGTNQIIDLIKKPPKTERQPDPFWCYLEGPHRLVYYLNAKNWYFPCFSEMQQGKVPWKLRSDDPHGLFTRPQFISERNIWGGTDKRVKLTYVDYTGNEQSLPWVFDLFINIWNDPSQIGCFKTPIVIDPGGSGRGEP